MKQWSRRLRGAVGVFMLHRGAWFGGCLTYIHVVGQIASNISQVIMPSHLSLWHSLSHAAVGNFHVHPRPRLVPRDESGINMENSNFCISVVLSK